MGEVVDFEVYLNINNEGFRKSDFNGTFMFDGDAFEGFIGENFIFGELTDRGLIIYTLFSDYRPVQYDTILNEDKNYEGEIKHHGNWEEKESFSCGLARIVFTKYRQYDKREAEELKNKISILKNNMNRDNQRFYGTIKTNDLPKKQQSKIKERVLVSA